MVAKQVFDTEFILILLFHLLKFVFQGRGIYKYANGDIYEGFYFFK